MPRKSLATFLEPIHKFAAASLRRGGSDVATPRGTATPAAAGRLCRGYSNGYLRWLLKFSLT
jgi:hypothetical protein